MSPDSCLPPSPVERGESREEKKIKIKKNIGKQRIKELTRDLGWAGHWRGENATDETVICDVSYTSRRWLSSVCGLGYTVAQSPLNTFWATDLLHRVLHLPAISEGVVGHFAEDYAGLLDLAREDPAKSAIDSDALQYFAIDVYAYDVAAPGEGCSGEVEGEDGEE